MTMLVSLKRRIYPYRRIVTVGIIVTITLCFFYITKSNVDGLEKFYQSRKASFDCERLFEGNDFVETPKMKEDAKETDSEIEIELLEFENCKQFLHYREYYTNNVSREEIMFPIAFSVLVDKNTVQFERLFRAIYRNSNIYCIHVAHQMNPSYYTAIKSLVGCFPNVIMATKRYSVDRSNYSLLEADLQCMQDLYSKYSNWKYLINLRGEEFPIKTNLELVRILNVFDGANNIGASVINKYTNEELKHPSFPITWVKGSTHITASRNFIKYILKSKKSKEILDILRDHMANAKGDPAKIFYSTMNHNPKSIPVIGAFNPFIAEPTYPIEYNFITKLTKEDHSPTKCKIKHVHQQPCDWSVKDLPQLINREELFVDNLNYQENPAVYSCLEESHMSRSIYNLQRKDSPIDVMIYKSMVFVSTQYRGESEVET